MTLAEDLALAAFSFRESLRLLENVIIAHPEAEDALTLLSMSDTLEPGTRALVKVLWALGTSALAQQRAELTVHQIADAQSTSSSYLN